MTGKQTKREREEEMFRQQFADGGRQTPPSTDLSHLAKLPPGVAPAPGTVDAPAPAHVRRPTLARVKVVVASTDLEQAAGGRRLRKRAAKAADTPTPPIEAAPQLAPAPELAPATPWAAAHPKVVKPYPLRLSEELHMKLAWLARNLPDTSMQKLIIEAIEQHAQALLAQHYPPAEKIVVAKT